MNPFENASTVNYKSFVKSQVETMSAGESKKIDLGEKGILEFRANLSYAQSDTGFKIKTKRDSSGAYWMARIAK